MKAIAFLNQQKLQSELAVALQASQQAQKPAAADDSSKAAAQADSEELVRLRKDNEELLKLRAEVHQLRDEKQVLTKQATVPSPNSQSQAYQNSQIQQLMAENQQLKAQSQVKAAADNMATCINFLRQIDGAKQQWALENQKPANALVTPENLLPYIKAMPTCPAGGVYTLNQVGLHPICSIPGHVLPKQ
jgi:alanyl-tRNA synthetase